MLARKSSRGSQDLPWGLDGQLTEDASSILRYEAHVKKEASESTLGKQQDARRGGRGDEISQYAEG